MPTPRLHSKLELLPIEENIPIPPINNNPAWRQPAKFLYGFERLKPGQSVFIPKAMRPPLKSISETKQRFGYTFTYRLYMAEDGKMQGCRVWRTY